jgi:hypothetical protein
MRVAAPESKAPLLRPGAPVEARAGRVPRRVARPAAGGKIGRPDKNALARESARLDPESERSLADEGLAADWESALSCGNRQFVALMERSRSKEQVRNKRGIPLADVKREFDLLQRTRRRRKE